ncbi:MAG: hypothetical protein K940chlam8_00889 [Chlamydiae bacterium]|nr:hypothetical protein [Chlamydiota bacterium]
MNDIQEHYKGKDTFSHLLEARGRGHVAGHEAHGIEPSGVKNAFIDTAKTLVTLLPFLALFFAQLQIPIQQQVVLMSVFAIGFVAWHTGRSCFLGWTRLEKLHRVMLQEKKEIEENRAVEKQELREIYALKGFEGKLLDDVVNQLIQDDSRLLQVMLEEELGISIYCQVHPLKQGFGALCGGLISGFFVIFMTFFYGWLGCLITSISILFICAILFAKHQNNRIIPSTVWQLALFGLSFGCVYFLLQMLM